jgi:hypothetical protein
MQQHDHEDGDASQDIDAGVPVQWRPLGQSCATAPRTTLSINANLCNLRAEGLVCIT